jgi:hypothetical protein
MDEKAIALGVLLVVAAISAVSVVMIYKNTSALATYEQPANNKPPFIVSSQYIENFNLCKQYTCKYGDAGYAETAPAELYGTEELTGNLVCGCPDGKMFQVRPDRIDVETY